MRIFLIVSLLFSSMIAFASDKVTELFTLDHQMSQACEKKIKDNLRFEKGISKIDVSLKENTIAITFDEDKTDTQNIIKGFKKIGFNAFLVSPDGEVPAKESCEHCQNHKNAAACENTPANACENNGGKACVNQGGNHCENSGKSHCEKK